MPNFCRILKDSDNEQLAIQIIDETGAVVSATPAIYLTLDDIDGADGVPRIAKFQLLRWKDSGTCQVMQAYVLMTTPEAAPP